MSIVSLVIAPTLADIHNTRTGGDDDRRETRIERTIETKGSNHDAFVAALKNDGLVASNNVSISFEDGVLTVNGKQQSDEVAARYAKYLSKGENLKFELREK
jgi:hypothetical protein